MREFVNFYRSGQTSGTLPPGNGDGYVTTYVYRRMGGSDDWAFQTAYDGATGKKYTRVLNSGTWSAWLNTSIRDKIHVGHESYGIWAYTAWTCTGIAVTIPGNCIYMLSFQPRFTFNAPMGGDFSIRSDKRVWENIGTIGRNLNDNYPTCTAVGYTVTGFTAYCWAYYNTQDHSSGQDSALVDWVYIDLTGMM